jgi:hypothetical protein
MRRNEGVVDKSMDLLIQEFEDGLMSYINKAQIPIKAKALILGNIQQVLSQAAAAMVAKERASLNKNTDDVPNEPERKNTK